MSDSGLPMRCEEFEARVSDFVDNTLSAAETASMKAHVTTCAECRALCADIAAIVRDARALPNLTPTRDLWAGVAERLDAPVRAIGRSSGAATARHGFSFRALAAAAVLLVAASSGATYMLTHAPESGAIGATVATTSPIVESSSATVPIQLNAAEPAVGDAGVRGANVGAAAHVPTSANVRNTANVSETPVEQSVSYATNTGTTTERAYEREISAMRRIVDERLGDLDSTTVMEIERNLRIIDKAITDSRRALENDPRSRFLSTQLDRALESKLGVLRRIALL